MASLSGLIIAAMLLYCPLLVDWFTSILGDPTFSYALWVPPLAVYMAYRQVNRIGKAAVKSFCSPSYTGYAVMAAGCLLLLAGEISTLLYIARLSFLLVLAGIALTVIGRKGLSLFSFPAGYLLFALPLPMLVYVPLSARLQMISSILAGESLDLMGVPALREGNIITLPNNQLEVIEACSGIHSLFALLAVAMLAGYLLRSRNAERLLIALTAIPMAIVLNSVRITILGVLSYQLGPGAAAGVAHLTTGLVIFMFGCIAIIGLCGRKPAGQAFQAAIPRLAIGPPFPSAKNEKLGSLLNVAAAVSMLALAMVLRGNVGFDRPVALRQQLDRFPFELDGWRGHDVTIPPGQLAVLRASAVIMRDYSHVSGSSVNLYVAYFAAQREGTAMHSLLHCIPGAGWEVARQSVLPISLAALGTIEANEVIFINGNARMLVVYWYMEQGRTERSELEGAMATLRHAVFERRTDGCLIRVSAPIVQSEEKTLNVVLKFVSQSAPLLLGRFLPRQSD
ncbi:MAG: EpsI family protein [Deltaproteobacteria bacterium]|nr:EpsI family protein [Deltaproteobacteria bacterium]